MGYLKIGTHLGPMMQKMMQKIHGSVSKLVHDLLPERRVPFFRDANHHDYYDGCLRDVLQADRTYRYIRIQPVRHGIVGDYRLYTHTRINIELKRAIKRAVELKAFLEKVPYTRYQTRQHRQGRFSDSG